MLVVKSKVFSKAPKDCRVPINLQPRVTTDYTLEGLQIPYNFHDDIIIVSTGSESDQINYVIECLKKLDEDSLRINFQ